MNRLSVFFLFFFPFLVFSQFNIEHSVYFDTDKFILENTEKTRLFKFIDSLPKKDVLKIEISGFCDDVGAENYNLVLSKNRAVSIKNVFSSVPFFPKKLFLLMAKEKFF